VDEMLIKNNIPLTDNNRCELLASPAGILGQSVEGLQKALMEGYDQCLHFVEYKDLVNNPQETMQKIYEFLGEEPFEHTFDNLKNENRENDGKIYGFADMHEVRPVVKSVAPSPEEILSAEILEKCQNTEFWRVLGQVEEEETETEEVSEVIVDDDGGAEDETAIIGAGV
jgi:hypothetical protein